ncbi:hypothetical protein GGI25_003127 [Coemansia spiralis]|uniref:Glutathione S-transferase n=2 Tax=Coemansia TaxID=4863 RepID=A0A9W8KYD9_9FUNG|nr:hypothetical protein BX070DRAFT_237454 [Coemansia spiralis]KAJ1991757.1 hypothetical protein EDC05_003254 [Coemansia umbellata]KAJ2621738.1 hypothetical protein GGI26_003833 [Coemansia sp. RSA 1358]KAJ2677492.1 hypothetical protein GGI25_003127 [Coemansia spiralis]
MPSYILRYFPIIARAEPAKALLTLAGVKWEFESPSWPSAKSEQPVGKLPVLIEISDNGSKLFVLSESLAIEEYLATKYGLYYKSQNPRLVAQQHELRSQMNELIEIVALVKYGCPDTGALLLPEFREHGQVVIKFHERALKKNGSNGHYFGNKTTYVDVAVFAVVHSLRNCFAKILDSDIDIFSTESAPEINRLMRTVAEDPALATYIYSLEH